MRDGSERPFFVWIHLFDPHTSYSPPEPFKSRYATNPYDGEVSFTDQQVGRFVDRLRESGLIDETIVVVAGDHGEGLGEHHERQHSLLIYESTMAVPLILYGPGVIPAGRVVNDRVVATTDIKPTILDLLGLDPGSGDGFSLLRANADTDRVVYIERLAPELNHGWSALYGLRRHRDKFIEAPTPEYYELNEDPSELRNLWPRKNGEATRLRDRLEVLISSFPTNAESADTRVELDAAAMKKLTALGYVGGAAVSRTGPPQDPKEMIEYWTAGIVAANQLVDRGRFTEAIVLLKKLLGDHSVDPGGVGAAQPRRGAGRAC